MRALRIVEPKSGVFMNAARESRTLQPFTLLDNLHLRLLDAGADRVQFLAEVSRQGFLRLPFRQRSQAHVRARPREWLRDNEAVPAPQFPRRLEGDTHQGDRCARAASNGDRAGFEFITGSAGAIGCDAQIVTGPDFLDQRSEGFTPAAAARSAHGLNADDREKVRQPGAISTRADQGVKRPLLAETTEEFRHQKKSIVPHHENRCVRLVP